MMGMDGVGCDRLCILGRLLAGVWPEPELSWEGQIDREIADLARHHDVSALLFWRLEHKAMSARSHTGREQVGKGERLASPEMAEQLRRDFYEALARGVVAERQLAEVLGALAAAEVPAVVIKGAALAAFYPDPALRLYGDLDLLVPRSKLDRAEEALQGMGFRTTHSKAWSLEYGYDLSMVRDDGQCRAEIHWRLDYPEGVGCLPAEELWERAVAWSVGGRSALRLEKVDTVLYLCSHATVKHHAHLGLRPLCDLAQATNGWQEAEWETLAQRAVAYGLARPVFLMLVLAEKVLGLSVPVAVMAALQPTGGAQLPPDVVDALLEPEPRTENGSAVRVPVAMTQAGAKRTFLARLHHVLWHLFLPPKGMAVVYNVAATSPRIWLTYLRRPADLMRRYGRFAWSLLRGERTAQRIWAREVWLERWLWGEGEKERDVDRQDPS